ncbi:MAG TPA: hypothetical protein VM925_11690 [Labilithrix sp.]|nr:hypothetical protein [Labilithrix sp.]
MGRVPPPRYDVEALHARLRGRIAELRPLVVADVMRAFLEISSLPCEQMLWSFEFAFDEDDGRIARIEARFTDHDAPTPCDEDLRGYEVELFLPKVIPAHAPADGVRAAKRTPENAAAHGSLVARFIQALADLGAYRTIETLEARAAEVHLL